VHHGERQGEIDLPSEIVDPEAGLSHHACLDPRVELGAFSASAERVKHLRLDVDSDDATRLPDKAREFEREEAHARAGLEHRHAFRDVSRQDRARILPEPPQRAREQVADPAGQTRCAMDLDHTATRLRTVQQVEGARCDVLPGAASYRIPLSHTQRFVTCSVATHFPNVAFVMQPQRSGKVQLEGTASQVIEGGCCIAGPPISSTHKSPPAPGQAQLAKTETPPSLTVPASVVWGP
jgi:hypothetical protein